VQEKKLLAKDDVKSAMTKCGIKFRAADNIQMLLQRIEAELPSIKLDAQASEDEDQEVEAEKTEDGQEVRSREQVGGLDADRAAEDAGEDRQQDLEEAESVSSQGERSITASQTVSGEVQDAMAALEASKHLDERNSGERKGESDEDRVGQGGHRMEERESQEGVSGEASGAKRKIASPDETPKRRRLQDVEQDVAPAGNDENDRGPSAPAVANAQDGDVAPAAHQAQGPNDVAATVAEHKGLCLHCNEPVLSTQLRGFRMKEGTKRYFHDHCTPAKVLVCYVCNQNIAKQDLDRDAKGPRHASCQE